MESDNTRVLDLILVHLEKLNLSQDKLSQEVQKINIELAKIGNLQGAVSDFKNWKDSIEKVLNAEDLKEMKKFFSQHQSIDADVTDLYLITKELREVTEDYKKFKVKALTIVSILSFLFTTALTIVAKFVH